MAQGNPIGPTTRHSPNTWRPAERICSQAPRSRWTRLITDQAAADAATLKQSPKSIRVKERVCTAVEEGLKGSSRLAGPAEPRNRFIERSMSANTLRKL